MFRSSLQPNRTDIPLHPPFLRHPIHFRSDATPTRMLGTSTPSLKASRARKMTTTKTIRGGRRERTPTWATRLRILRFPAPLEPSAGGCWRCWSRSSRGERRSQRRWRTSRSDRRGWRGRLRQGSIPGGLLSLSCSFLLPTNPSLFLSIRLYRSWVLRWSRGCGGRDVRQSFEQRRGRRRRLGDVRRSESCCSWSLVGCDRRRAAHGRCLP